jgi:hypothetical protein
MSRENPRESLAAKLRELELTDAERELLDAIFTAAKHVEEMTADETADLDTEFGRAFTKKQAEAVLRLGRAAKASDGIWRSGIIRTPPNPDDDDDD